MVNQFYLSKLIEIVDHAENLQNLYDRRATFCAAGDLLVKSTDRYLEQAEQAFGRVSAHPPLIVYSAPQGGTRDPRTAFEILKAASEGAAERQRQFGADQSDGIQNIRLLAESIKLHQRVNFGLRITLKELSILSKQATQDELATASPQTRRRMSFHGPKSARVPQ